MSRHLIDGARCVDNFIFITQVSSVYQLVLTISIMVSQILSSTKVFGTDSEWPLLFGLIAIPAILQVILLPLCADSPRYLQSMKREEDAKKGE